MTGRLYGVGLGPGDPELVTVKAARLIGAADVVAFHAAQHGRSVARALAAPYLREGQVEELLVYPVTTETTDHPGGYQGAIDEFYEAAAARLAAHLDAGRDVVVLAEGDPFFYGSYMHMHKRLAHRYPTEVVPGVTSVSGAAAVLGRPLVERDEVLTVLPGTLPAEELAEWLATTDSAAVMKLGRTFRNVRDAFEEAGVLDRAYYVERATTDRQRVAPLADVDPDTVPYFSLALLPSELTPVQAPNPEPVSAPNPAEVGEVVVVGLGPGQRSWTTPETAEALARADDLVGYGPYLDRVPANPRQVRHPSDNRVEAERAAAALRLAQTGRRVAVVSSGDPGVFAMAAAVLEVAAQPEFADVEVRVLPGLTAAQAVASRVGAPLGHDFCVLSLSDVLKPWDVVLDRLRHAAAADLVIALYNPRSRARPHQLAEARDLLLEVRKPETVVVVGRDVGGPEESVTVTTLDAFAPETVDMRCLVLIGSTQTRVTPAGAVYTSRRYPGG
ncbi:Cobalamin biosynthesis protein cobIJ [Includes: Precorrin-2 C(20)-methyltransferase; Precorrin-3B C17-methyltransferase] [Modestobacter italicus]|uniref:Cobalamin biosynthesis protein cobIJ n=1 Tax=Modestobacter italicus (strain DSM 44449 / CECT 9708 / BC 501) TaxID=2732864 RepID=I4ERU9_MODI5|nr:precorrin-2 C(20)-methyltransferase [Modestobacter marinus]CCH86112.1 Cobalamin biosynthesis protein cobIJ [Includes: Precorrin-2 C(20)-methyltransferase; Precorrin-3B C17-methyltransferase] [Modestobacter marinus]